MLFGRFQCTEDVGCLKSMLSDNVPLKVSTLLLKELNAFKIDGSLGSMPAGNAALVYMFIMLSNKAPFCQRNMVSAGRPRTSALSELIPTRLQRK